MGINESKYPVSYIQRCYSKRRNNVKVDIYKVKKQDSNKLVQEKIERNEMISSLSYSQMGHVNVDQWKTRKQHQTY